MAGSIKNINISGYSAGYTYQQYDVVSYPSGNRSLYFVSVSGQHSAQLDTVSYASNASWKRFDDVSWAFTDVWTPTYGSQINLEPKPKLAVFGDGYVQRSDGGLFGNLLGYEMTFKDINNQELKSLVAFFEYKGGADYFISDLNSFITGRRFIGKNWKHDHKADNINDFSVSLFESISS